MQRFHLENRLSRLLNKTILQLGTLPNLVGIVQLVSQMDRFGERGMERRWRGTCGTLAVHLFLIKERSVTVLLGSVVMDGHVIFQEEFCLKQTDFYFCHWCMVK